MERVRETFRVASVQCVGVMLVVMVLCQWRPEVLVAFFSKDPEVIRVGALFLHLISWNFVMSGLIFTCSGLFQALAQHGAGAAQLGLETAGLRRAAAVAHVAAGLLDRAAFWYLSIAASAVQAVISVSLLGSRCVCSLALLCDSAGVTRQRQQLPSVVGHQQDTVMADRHSHRSAACFALQSR